MAIGNRIGFRVFCSAALVLWFTTGGLAAPVDFSQVGADANWLVHLDVDTMRHATLAARLYQQATLSQNELKRRLSDLRSHLGFDPAKDLHGITLYGKQLGKPHGVLLVHADFDVDLLLRKVALAPDHKVSSYRGHDLHSWTDAQGEKQQHTAIGVFFRPNLLVFAPNLDEMTAAIDVLDGRQPSLRGNTSAMTVEPLKGAMVALRAVGLNQAELPFKSPLVTQSETVRLDVAETEGELVVEAVLGLKSSETVEQVEAVLGGLRAMAALRAQDDPETASLIERVKTTVQDKTLHVDFRVPVEDLWQVVVKSRPAHKPDKE